MVRRALLALLVAFAGAIATAPGAAAHTGIESTAPVAGSEVDAPVFSVVVRFLDPVAEADLRVTGPDGTALPGVDPGPLSEDGRSFVTSTPTIEEPGTYRVDVSWSAADGATQSDAFTFRVRRATVPAVEPTTTSLTSTTVTTVTGDKSGGMLPLDLDILRLFLHVLAATVWVGGQLTLAGLVPGLRALGEDVPRTVARRFNRIAWPAFGVLVATGVWNLAEVSLTDRSNAYQATVMAKLGLVALSGIAAVAHSMSRSKVVLAVGGALGLLGALGALLLGVQLGVGG